MGIIQSTVIALIVLDPGRVLMGIHNKYKYKTVRPKWRNYIIGIWRKIIVSFG
jgi:hypothetical protein